MSTTISRGSRDEIFLVQLFSMPQQMHAIRTKRDPVLNVKLEMSSKESCREYGEKNAVSDFCSHDHRFLKMNKMFAIIITVQKN